jgi:hypothetical protein
VLDLPRSARLAAWGTAVLRGEAAVEQLVGAVTGDDEAHQVHDPDLLALPLAGGGPASPGLADLIAGLRHRQVGGLRLVLPVPGDVLGLPGPPAFNVLALESGEAVLAVGAPGPGPGLVPEITRFGSSLEPGALVTWHVRPIEPPRVTDVGSLAEAERALREALRAAADGLARLDVTRWRPDAAARVDALRDGGLPAGALPPSAPARCASVLATAARVRGIVALAVEDDGAALSAHEARLRTEALRDLDAVSRRAVVAAVNGLLEPRRDHCPATPGGRQRRL